LFYPSVSIVAWSDLKLYLKRTSYSTSWCRLWYFGSVQPISMRSIVHKAHVMTLTLKRFLFHNVIQIMVLRISSTHIYAKYSTWYTSDDINIKEIPIPHRHADYDIYLASRIIMFPKSRYQFHWTLSKILSLGLWVIRIIISA